MTKLKMVMKEDDGCLYLRRFLFVVPRCVVEATRVVGFFQVVLAVHVVRVLQVGRKLGLFESCNVMHSRPVVEHPLDSVARGKCRP